MRSQIYNWNFPLRTLQSLLRVMSNCLLAIRSHAKEKRQRKLCRYPKSTQLKLRQVGLLALMTQIGYFGPTGEATIGLVDKIFTRVGASDNLAAGESTFLVEINEAANILNNATPNSLILLDEIGRGTSTFDGLSMAWSLSEYLLNKPIPATPNG